MVKTPQRIIVCSVLCCAAVCVNLWVAAMGEQRAVERRLRQAVALWKPELVRSLATGDWLLTGRLARSINDGALVQLTVDVDGSQHAWSNTPGEQQCALNITVPIEQYGLTLAKLNACLSWLGLLHAALAHSSTSISMITLSCLTMFAVFYPLSRYRAALRRSINLLKEWVETPHGDLPAVANEDRILQEMFCLVQDGVARSLNAEKRLADGRKLQDMAELSAQVAHDIRSPLAALDMTLRDVTGLAESHRVLLRSAVNRINDIANVLLSRHRGAPGLSTDSPDDEPLATLSLSDTLDVLLTEMRLRHRAKVGVTFDRHLNVSAYGIFVRAQATEFKRVLSNLVNNAVEAIETRGSVRMAIASSDGIVCLKILDTGSGMPADVLARVGERGVTCGKAQGVGLGLYHAVRCLKAWGGKLRVESTPGEGTTVTLHLVQAAAPAWFVPHVQLHAGETVVVVDDDESIHLVWKQRLAQYADSVRVIHLTTPAELLNFAADNLDACLYLMDYELIGYDTTGLDLLAKIDAHRAILVTSRADEPAIQHACAQRGIPLLGKSAASTVALRIDVLQAPEIFDAVLIDDDPLVRQVWELAARRCDKKIAMFSGPVAFMAKAAQICCETPIYLDYSLGDGIDATMVATQIKARGFHGIYFATGHAANTLPQAEAVIAVVGKEPPPWLLS